MQLSVQPNVDAAGNSAFAMQLNRARPMPGRWRFLLLLNYFTSGTQTSLPFTAQIGLDGPFGPAGAPPTPVSTSVVAQLKAFDGAISADSGDLWQDVVFGTSTFTTGLVLAPGETGTIKVTIRPESSQIGQVVRGAIYIDTFNGTVQTGDEVVQLPYACTVVR